MLAGHTGPAVSAVWFADGRTLATASDDHTARLRDVPGSALVGHRDSGLRGRGRPLGARGRHRGYDRTVRVWDPETGADLAVLDSPADAVNSVAFSPDGHLLAGASADHVVRLWRVAELAEVAKLVGHTDRVYALAFTPDDHALFSGSGDRTTRRWEVGVDHAAERICATVSPPLTRSDWTEHFAGLPYRQVCDAKDG